MKQTAPKPMRVCFIRPRDCQRLFRFDTKETGWVMAMDGSTAAGTGGGLVGGGALLASGAKSPLTLLAGDHFAMPSFHTMSVGVISPDVASDCSWVLEPGPSLDPFFA